MPATADTPPLAEIDAVRRFSRFYTRIMGVLDEGLNGTAYPLPEARVLWEIGSRGTATGRDLARDLGLDPGYVSRLLRHLEDKGAILRAPSPGDARQIDVTLSPAGAAHYDDSVARARAMVAGLLTPLAEADRRALVDHLARVETLLEPAASRPAVLRPHRIGDMGWVVQSQAEFYAAAYGWDLRYEALVAEIVAKFLRTFDPAREACWIAERCGARVGSVFVVADDAETARLRLLYVDPAVRGHGLGRVLVDTALAFARERGYRRVRLWTNDNLDTARRIYEKAGFQLVATNRHRDFGPELTGQTWERPLAGA